MFGEQYSAREFGLATLHRWGGEIRDDYMSKKNDSSLLPIAALFMMISGHPESDVGDVFVSERLLQRCARYCLSKYVQAQFDHPYSHAQVQATCALNEIIFLWACIVGQQETIH